MKGITCSSLVWRDARSDKLCKKRMPRSTYVKSGPCRSSKHTAMRWRGSEDTSFSMSTYNKEQVSGNWALQVCNICKHFVHTSVCFGPPPSALDCKTKLSDSFTISLSSLEVNPLSSSTADTMSIIWSENNRETIVIQQDHESSMVKDPTYANLPEVRSRTNFFCAVVKKWENKVMRLLWLANECAWHIKQYVYINIW